MPIFNYIYANEFFLAIFYDYKFVSSTYCVANCKELQDCAYMTDDLYNKLNGFD